MEMLPHARFRNFSHANDIRLLRDRNRKDLDIACGGLLRSKQRIGPRCYEFRR